MDSCSELAIIIMAIALDCHDCPGWCFGTTVISNARVDSLLLHNWRTLTSQVWAVGSVKLSGRCCKGLDKGLERFRVDLRKRNGGDMGLGRCFPLGRILLDISLANNECMRAVYCTIQ